MVCHAAEKRVRTSSIPYIRSIGSCQYEATHRIEILGLWCFHLYRSGVPRARSSDVIHRVFGLRFAIAKVDDHGVLKQRQEELALQILITGKHNCVHVGQKARVVGWGGGGRLNGYLSVLAISDLLWRSAAFVFHLFDEPLI